MPKADEGGPKKVTRKPSAGKRDLNRFPDVEEAAQAAKKTPTLLIIDAMSAHIASLEAQRGLHIEESRRARDERESDRREYDRRISELEDNRVRLIAELARKDELIRATAGQNLLAAVFTVIGTLMLGGASLATGWLQGALAVGGAMALLGSLANLGAATWRARQVRGGP
jgi:hypothetical protein